MRFLILALLLQTACSTVYLTSNDFEEKTSGKKAIVAFKAPWCGHCKKLKPDWDKLSDAVDVLVGEVDCTVEKDLCGKHGVQGYPTIRWSSGYGWNKYEKARDYDSLETFVQEELADGCFDDESLCTKEQLLTLKEARSLSTKEIDDRLAEISEEKEAAESTFKAELQKLQNRYQELTNDKNSKIDELSKEEGYLKYVTIKTDL
jgi:protein disulfide-isomerase-like protein